MRQGTWEGQGEDFGIPIPPPYSSEPQTPTYTLTPRPYMEFVPPAAIHHFSEQALNDQVTDTPDFGEPPPGTDAWEEWAQRTDAKLEWLRELVENPQNTDAGTQLAEDTIMEHVIKRADAAMLDFSTNIAKMQKKYLDRTQNIQGENEVKLVNHLEAVRVKLSGELLEYSKGLRN